MGEAAGAQPPSMARLVTVSVLLGLLGFVLVPVAIMIAVLGLAYSFDPRCGSPGDSGGCEMGAASIAMVSAVPGFLIFFFVPLIRGLRRRNCNQAGGA